MQFDGHIREVTVYSPDEFFTHLTFHDFMPAPVTLRWRRNTVDSFSAVVTMLPHVETLVLQETVILDAIIVPMTVKEVVLVDCCFNEAAITAILPRNGEIVISGDRTRFQEGKIQEGEIQHDTCIPILALTLDFFLVKSQDARSISQALRNVTGAKRLDFVGEMDRDGELFQQLIDSNAVTVTELIMGQKGTS